MGGARRGGLNRQVRRQTRAGSVQLRRYQARAEIGVDRASQGAEHLGRLGAIDGAAPAETHDHVRIEGAQFRFHAGQVRQGRVGSGAGNCGRDLHSSRQKGRNNCFYVPFRSRKYVADQHSPAAECRA